MFTCDTSVHDTTTLVTNILLMMEKYHRAMSMFVLSLYLPTKKKDHIIWDVIEQTIKFLLGGILTLTVEN